MTSNEYWEKRAEQVLIEAELRTNTYLNQFNTLYKSTAESIDKEIVKIFDTYRKDFTELEANVWLSEEISRYEYNKLKDSLSTITDERYKKQVLMQLNAPAYRYRITRLQHIKQAILTELSKSADIQLRLSKECYIDVLNQSYNRTMFDIQRGTGIAFDFAKLPHETINRLLTAKWHGRNFSSSIWQNSERVAKAASDIIKEGVLSGQGISQMSRALKEKTYTQSMYNATRLIRTEVNYFSNQGALESYKEAELDKYEFCATLDLRTSVICGELDSGIYPLDNAVVGENYPPMHPYCRSCAIPIVEVEGFKRMDKRRARNPITGENEVVDGMSYKEWREKYVEGNKLLPKPKVFTVGGKSDIISVLDIQIGRSLGAAAFTDGVKLPDGMIAKIAENSKITKVVVFAGKGTAKPIKVVAHLSKQFDVPESEWKKVRGDGYVAYPDGRIKHVELHWFESDKTGRVKMKVKREFE